MALLFLDSADHLANTAADKTLKYIDCPGTIAAGGRTGNCYAVAGAGSVFTMYRALPGPGGTSINSTLVVGMAYKTAFLTGRMAVVGNSIGGITANLWHSFDGRLYCSLSGGSVSGGSASVFTTDVWYYVEWSAYFYVVGATAYCDNIVRVNNQVVLTTTCSGGAVPAAAERGWSYFGVQGGPGSGLQAWADDIYVTDGEFLGDIRIYVIRPNAPGDAADWTPVGAASDWEATKDLTPDYAATYISSPTPGQADMVNLEDIGLLGIIKGMQANFVVTKTDAGDASFIPRYKVSGVAYDSLREFFPSWQGWRDFTDAYRKNPITGNDWTVAEINALQQGLTRIT